MCYRYRVVFRSTYFGGKFVVGTIIISRRVRRPEPPFYVDLLHFIIRGCNRYQGFGLHNVVHVKLRVQDGYTHLWRSALTGFLPTVRVRRFGTPRTRRC
jgi:hypothetical protein